MCIVTVVHAVQILDFCRNFDLLEILISAYLNYFNGGMFNCLHVIWLGPCNTNHIKCFRKNFVKILHVPN